VSPISEIAKSTRRSIDEAQALQNDPVQIPKAS